MTAVYVGDGKVLLTMAFGGKLVCPADDLALTPILVEHGVLEPELTRWAAQNIQRGDTVIDVGAEFGYTALVFCSIVGPGGKVVALEPNPRLYELLVDNIRFVNYYTNCEFLNAAAWYEAGTANLYFSKKCIGGGTLVNTKWRKIHTGIGREPLETEVKLVTLDSVCAEMELTHVDLVKTDTEGAEWKVFQGMKTMIENNLVKAVIWENARGAMGEDREALYDYLLSQKAQHFTLGPQGEEQPLGYPRATFETGPAQNILTRFLDA